MEKAFQTACEIENKLISLLQVADPDAENGDWVELDIRRLNQKLTNEGFQTSPEKGVTGHRMCAYVFARAACGRTARWVGRYQTGHDPAIGKALPRVVITTRAITNHWPFITEKSGFKSM
jgi:hypothetical protein